jgi:hypothetical protein
MDSKAQIQTLSLRCSSSVQVAAENFVKAKYAFDMAILRHSKLALFVDQQLISPEGRPHTAYDYCSLVLPFFRPVETEESSSCNVPVANTLGCSWRWRGCDLSRDEYEGYLEYFCDPLRANVKDLGASDYLVIEAIGLILPIEGKNRVDFMRSENIEFIPTNISRTQYIQPSRLKLFNLVCNGEPLVFCVLDGEWVQRLRFPRLALPLLAALGVETLEHWPADWLSVAIIKDRLLKSQKRPPVPFANRTDVWPQSVQLSVVLARDQREKLMHAVCLADFAIFKFRQTTLAILLRSFCFFIVVVSSLAYFLFSNLNELFAYVVGLFIAFFSLFLLSFVKIFEAPRILVDRQKWRDWYSPDRPN